MITGTRMTANEFEQVCHELGSCELVRGEVVILSPGGMNHSGFAANVAILLGQWAKSSKSGRIWTNEAGIVVERDPDTVRGADVAYISYSRLAKGISSDSFSNVPPELVVEILGKGQGWTEILEKVGEYLAMGVDRIWVLDRETQRVHVYRPDHEPIMLNRNDVMEDAAVLPGFSCKVAEFFET